MYSTEKVWRAQGSTTNEAAICPDVLQVDMDWTVAKLDVQDLQMPCRPIWSSPKQGCMGYAANLTQLLQLPKAESWQGRKLRHA